MADERWVETPMFMLRKDCLHHATTGWKPGRFLEVGAGTGRLTAYLLQRGFTGVCHDLGSDSRDLLRRTLSPFGGKISVVDTLGEVDARSFDYLFAFEVLEHIDADAEALTSWSTFLKPGGRLLISVPAHMRKFGSEDRAVGHFRRYERSDLARLFAAAGCSTLTVLSYGFPLAILTRRGNQLLSHYGNPPGGSTARTQEALTIMSGVERSEASVRLSRILTRRTLAPFIALQRLFFKTDLGDGYVAHAVCVGTGGVMRGGTT
jgi:SAM-dependent methyltransferase